MTTDTSERGLERLICTALTGSPCDPGVAEPEPLDDTEVESDADEADAGNLDEVPEEAEA